MSVYMFTGLYNTWTVDAGLDHGLDSGMTVTKVVKPLFSVLFLT